MLRPSVGGSKRSIETSDVSSPHTATHVRFDFYGDESGNEAVPTKQESVRREETKWRCR